MLTLSDLAAESQAVLRLGVSRVMVINNTEREGERERDTQRQREIAVTNKVYLGYEYN